MTNSSSQDSAGKREIMVFGDSVMKGVVLEGSGTHYKLLPPTAQEKIEADCNVRLLNRSHFGQTIQQGASLVRRVIGKHPACRTVVLEFGGNDCDYDWEAVSGNPEGIHSPNTVLTRFISLYTQLIDYLKSSHIKPVLMNLPPIDSQRYLDYIVSRGLSRERILSFLGDVNMIYRFQELYSHTVERIALQTDSLLIDVRQPFLGRRDFKDLLCLDGIHPNAGGHDLLYHTIRDFISEHTGLPDGGLPLPEGSPA